jgi:hypothetical protein
MTTPTPVPNPVHPKVKAAAITGVALTVVVAALAAVTPQLLTFAGTWSVVVYAGVVALGASLAGYIKKP